ncbi:FAD-dependent monooxygenase [Modicisalibacter luteus]|uniref:FAD-dependent monooxygenase n=1 Tax=Modicisalibacter luteus TaxID=453962 RepID=UPI00363AF36C
MAQFENRKSFTHDDDSVVVIIGSGAGGGTLANELAQQGIDVVVLEAGALHDRPDFLADEWPAFSQLSWLDNRTTSGSWRIAKDFPNLPTWICKTVGAPRRTGPGPACASSRMSLRCAPTMARWRAPTCSTGR